MNADNYREQLWRQMEYYANQIDSSCDAYHEGRIDRAEYNRRLDVLERQYFAASDAMDKYREATDPVWAVLALAQQEYRRAWESQNGPVPARFNCSLDRN